MRAWLTVLLFAACGERALPAGPPLGEAANVTIVAHQDDDLIFMQPDITDVVEDRSGLVSVYVTAGEGNATGGEALAVTGRRNAGLLEAYAEAAGLLSEWDCGAIEIAGHAAQHCRLDEARVSLVFLGYPDGGKDGERPHSLLRLWQAEITGADAIGLEPAHYDQAGLIATIAEIVTVAKPSTIRTLEIAATHGRDHSDHMITGALALLGASAAGSTAELIAYRGYGIEEEPASLIDPLYDRSANLVAHYNACATGCGECGTACRTITSAHATWLRRRYAVGTRPSARGFLRTGDLCANVSADGAPTSAPCSPTSTRWELTRDGVLRAGNGRCFGLLLSGEGFASTTCTPEPQRRFFLDDDGHLWSGLPPLAEPDMAYAHLWCIVLAGGRPRAALCGRHQGVRWQLADEPVTAPRSIPTLPGRAVRLADLTGDAKADLCFVDAGTLRCAPGTGDGTFDAPSAIAALSVEPESLVLADVDGDRRADACGRDATGITCALSTTAFTPSVFSPAFARSGPADATDRSLSGADADGDGKLELCGLTDQGVVCAFRGQSPLLLVRSAWPMANHPLWSADLDGDARADWCASPGAGSGAACGLDRDRTLTTDGVPWAYAFQSRLAAAPADTTVGALADLDGDRRADLCTLRGRSIACARSQGYAFGPEIPLATFPGTGPLTALWLGDLDGDGVTDACAEDGGAIACARR